MLLAALSAAKIIYITEGQQIIDTRPIRNGENNQSHGPIVLQNLRMGQAISLLENWGVVKSSYNLQEDPSNTSHNHVSIEPQSGIEYLETNKDWSSISPFLRLMARYNVNLSNKLFFLLISMVIVITLRCVHALSKGVRRAHLLAPTKGALLKELYTRDGAGLLISRDVYEGVRQAQASDVRAVGI